MVSLRKLIPFKVRLRVEIEVFKTLAKGSRIVEYPYVIRNVSVPTSSKILVFGGWNDFAALQLASLGFNIVAFDLQDNVFHHPNFKYVKGDFLVTSKDFMDNYFEAAIALSSIEHVGLDAYKGPLIESGDELVVKQIHRLLKPGGTFIFTVPFGRKGAYPKKKPNYRKYDREALHHLLQDFKIVDMACYGCSPTLEWLPMGPDKLENEAEADTPRGVIGVCAQKPN
jgi:SAM-dependent methyltransferase